LQKSARAEEGPGKISDGFGCVKKQKVTRDGVEATIKEQINHQPKSEEKTNQKVRTGTEESGAPVTGRCAKPGVRTDTTHDRKKGKKSHPGEVKLAIGWGKARNNHGRGET